MWERTLEMIVVHLSLGKVLGDIAQSFLKSLNNLFPHSMGTKTFSYTLQKPQWGSRTAFYILKYENTHNWGAVIHISFSQNEIELFDTLALITDIILHTHTTHQKKKKKRRKVSSAYAMSYIQLLIIRGHRKPEKQSTQPPSIVYASMTNRNTKGERNIMSQAPWSRKNSI